MNIITQDNFAVIGSGTLYDTSTKAASEKAAWFAGRPCSTASGALLSVFQTGPYKNDPTSTLKMCRSYNQGEEWQVLKCVFETVIDGIPGSLSNGELIEVTPGNLMLLSTWIDRSSPDRAVFDSVTEGLLHTRILCAFSKDDGDSWSTWKVIQVPSIEYSLHTSGPIVKLHDGQIAFVMESHKTFDDNCQDLQSEGTWLMVSNDGAKNFKGPFLVAQDPRQKIYYWDSRMCASKHDNELFFLFWTHDREHKKDINVHSCSGHFTGESFKMGLLNETNIYGQISSPVMLENGRILSLVIDRERPGTIGLWEMVESVRWEKCCNIYVHENQVSTEVSMDNIEIREIWENISKWNFGHPSVLPLDNQNLLISFYAGNADHLDIKWVKVRIA